MSTYETTRSPFAFYEPLQDGPLAIAHRGGNAANRQGPDGAVLNNENTLAAFESAWRRGILYGETDTVQSSDGVPMAFHGDEEGLPSRKQIQSMTYQEIRQMKPVGSEPMPSIEELLVTFPDMRFFIDPKTPRVTRYLAPLIDRMGVYERISIGSFYNMRTKRVTGQLETSKPVANTLSLAGFLALMGAARSLPGARSYLRHAGPSAFALPFGRINAEHVEVARDLGMPISVWTPNTQEDIENSFAAGVDGVMSDETELVLAAAKARR